MRNFLGALAIVMLAIGCRPEEVKPQNILIILADDLGFSDLGCYGGEIKTPNLDGLAAKGLRYTQFYNTARCWPTRASLLTGFYAQQINRDLAPGIKQGRRPEWAWLLPNYIKDAGYRSYHSGKWHIDGMPVENGFDGSYYLRDQNRFFSPEIHWEDDQRLPPVERGTGYYSTVEIADRAIGHLKEHKTKYADKPFFAYVAFTAPHFPLQALQEDIDIIGNRYERGWDAIRQQRWERILESGIAEGQLSGVERHIGSPYHFPEDIKLLGNGEVSFPIPWDSLSQEQMNFQQVKMTIHAAMIERMDKEVGRILNQLRVMDAYHNTLIVFLSDNGASTEIRVRKIKGDGHDPKAAPGSADSYLCLGPGWSTVSNTPFRRHKTWVHEGGICTPFIVHWPNGIKAQGELRRDPGHVIDIVPTILDIAGIPEPAHVPTRMYGQSLLPTFKKDIGWKRELWWYHEGHPAMRIGDWKIVSDNEYEWELFNLDRDRTESSNLAGGNPEKVRELEERWQNMLDGFREVSPEPSR